MSNDPVIDTITAIGAALILVGVGWIYLPAALITAGLMLIAITQLPIHHHDNEGSTP